MSSPIGWWRKLHRKFRQIAFYEHWTIGIVDASTEASLHWRVCPKPQWLNTPSEKYYLADPFAWPGDLKTILCEEYDFAARRGSIVRLTLGENGIEQKTPVVFSLPGHLSFPFLFEHDGNVYCIPESGAAGRITIFKWENSGFIEYATPLKNVNAADSIFFRHEGLCWIAYTDMKMGTSDNLNLLFAPELNGPWKPHPGNPVRLDLRNSRNAGPLFKKNGALYRPAQDCSETYGGAIRIMKIEECTPDGYREEEVTKIMPETGMNPHGLHTLAPFGNRSLVDAKRLVFSVPLIFQKAWRRVSGKRLP